jgi:serine/threonine-protein kinase RsbW
MADESVRHTFAEPGTVGMPNVMWSTVHRDAGGYVVELVGQDGVPARDRSVELQVEAALENLAVLRTLVAAVAAFEDLDLDAVADLRLAVDEACTRLIRSAVPGSSLRVVVDPSHEALVIRASARCMVDGSVETAVVEPGSFSWHVLSSLMDEVSTFADGQAADGSQVLGISLTARRVSLLQ